MDQLSIIVRYAMIFRLENRESIELEVEEVFSGFYVAIGQGAEDLVNEVVKKKLCTTRARWDQRRE